MKKVVEKPEPKDAPTNLVAVGKYIITKDVLDTLAGMESGKSGEIRLADAFDIMLASGKSIYGKVLDGEWLDTGTKLNFLKATVKMALKHDKLRSDFKKFLKEVTKEQ